MEDRRTWLEVLLQKNYEQNSIAKILTIDEKPGTNKGDNYMSEIKRVKMDVILKSGKHIKKSVILKCLPQSQYHQMLLKEMSMFGREITMYRDITPKMEDVLREFSDYTEPMWGTLIDYRANDTLIFNDLAENGYIMGSRKEGLDLEHCTLVMRSLAKFHAASVILRERGYIDENIFDKHVFQREKSRELMQDFYSHAINGLLENMETSWEPEWKPTIERIRSNILPNILDIVFKGLGYDEKKFNVLNHGDFWVNNMLFKYGLDSSTPIAVKFVDLQVCFFSSPVYDLQYFLSSSLNAEVRENHYEKLVEIYHKALVKQLEMFEYKVTIMSYEELMEEMESRNIFGLMTAQALLPYVYRDECDESFPDMEDTLKLMHTEEKVRLPGCSHPNYSAVLKHILKRMIKSNNI